MATRSMVLKQKAVSLDYWLCRSANSWLKQAEVHRAFVLISRLGDGVFWYVLILSLPFLIPDDGTALAIVMSAVGLLNVFVYKRIKKSLARPRPFVRYAAIQKGAPVLDEYSFPSGHTLHAVTFAVVLVAYSPLFASVFVPIALLTAASRVILGVHYPSDVLFGAALGLLHGWVAVVALSWIGLI